MASSSNTKGSNPAPDFALLMNRIQVSLDSGSRSADFIQQYKKQAAAKQSSSSSSTSLASTSNQPTSATGGAFSSLQSSKPTNSIKPSNKSLETDHAARLAAEEAEFADDRSADPNAGIGFARPKGAGLLPTTQRERDTQKLRGRLLGGRNKHNAGSRDDHAAGDARRRLAMRGRGGGESSDDEPGRSGLGRAKKVVKRRREAVDSSDEEGKGVQGVSEEVDSSRMASPTEQDDNPQGNGAQSGQSIPSETMTPAEDVQPPSESKARRKKKKKANKPPIA